jgi:hypothetical protein
MNIDDILGKEFGVNFKEVDEYLIKEMKLTAGKGIIKQMEETFGSGEMVKKWYFSEIPFFGNLRPYDLCKEGRFEEVSEEISRINQGHFL